MPLRRCKRNPCCHLTSGLIVIGCAFFLVRPLCRADETEYLASLRGVTSGDVTVAPMAVDTPVYKLLADRGITSEKLHDAVELELRRAGIKVASAEDGPKNPNNVHLIANLIALEIKEPQQGQTVLIGYAYQLRVYQLSTLIRDPTIKVGGVTWEDRPVLALCGTEQTEKIREDIIGAAKRFTAAFQHAAKK